MKPKTTTLRRTETRLETIDPARAAAIRCNPPSVLCLNEAACLLNIATRTLRQRIADRTIPHLKIGGRVLIPRDELFKSIAARTIAAV